MTLARCPCENEWKVNALCKITVEKAKYGLGCMKKVFMGSYNDESLP